MSKKRSSFDRRGEDFVSDDHIEVLYPLLLAPGQVLTPSVRTENRIGHGNLELKEGAVATALGTDLSYTGLHRELRRLKIIIDPTA